MSKVHALEGDSHGPGLSYLKLNEIEGSRNRIQMDHPSPWHVSNDETTCPEEHHQYDGSEPLSSHMCGFPKIVLLFFDQSH
jgi:hypothetical protein